MALSVHYWFSSKIAPETIHQKLKQRHPDFPFPCHSDQLFWGNPKVFPGQSRNIVPRESLVLHWITSLWDIPKTPHQGGGMDLPNQMPKPCQLASSLLDDWVSHSISKGEPRNPAEQTPFSHLNLQSCSFSHYSELVSTDKGRNSDWPINRELYLLSQLSHYHDRPVQHSNYCKCSTNPSTYQSSTPFFSPSQKRHADTETLLWVGSRARTKKSTQDHGFRLRGTGSHSNCFTFSWEPLKWRL